jgi:NAD(P)-dependent dehydrogenase (short-subunit alcohol dehydrogenase family)
MSRHDEPLRIAVTGAGRGIGLEFARRWLERGDRVFALARRPAKSTGLAALALRHAGALRSIECDVGDDDSVARARTEVEEGADRLDLVVNNAAVFGARNASVETLALADVRHVFEVNVLGALRVSRAFLPLLRRGRRPALVHISSLLGSIADNSSGGYWDYRLSKAALNMAARNLAIELKQDGVLSVALHPGWVRTDMGGPDAPLGVEEAVAAMVRTIDALGPDQSGGFYDRTGRPAPW